MKPSTSFICAAGLAVAYGQAWSSDYTSQDLTFNATTFDLTFNANWTAIAHTCVAPESLNSCQTNVTSTYQSCITTCSSSKNSTSSNGDEEEDDCQSNCQCTKYTSQLNCAMEFCWNRVYGCEYQKTAFNIVDKCDISDGIDSTSDSDSGYSGDSYSSFFNRTGIPYFPAPADAPGACSCNLASAFEAVDLEILSGANCNQNDTGDSISKPCGCCAYSGAYSSFYQICPSTSPAEIGIDIAVSYNLDGFNSTGCDATLDSTACVADLGFYALPDNSTTFYQSTDLASAFAKATGTLSDLTGQVTSPASGYTLTWTANSTPYTITATKATVTPDSSSGAATGSGASTGSATARSSGLAAPTGRVELGAGAVVAGLVAMAAHL